MQMYPDGKKCEAESTVVRDNFTICMNGEKWKKAELMLFDLNGNKLYSGEFTHEITINVREFSRGRYIGFIHSGRDYEVIQFRKE